MCVNAGQRQTNRAILLRLWQNQFNTKALCLIMEIDMDNVIDFKTPLQIHEEGVKQAKKAVEEWLFHWRMTNPEANEEYGEPLYCGFAWVNIRPATTKLKSMFSKAFPGASIIKTGSNTAEMVKYMTNS